MDVTEYYINIPASKRPALIDSLKDYRVWVEENDPDNALWMQGHPGLHEVFVEMGVPFHMIMSGSVWDLHVEVASNGDEVLGVNNHTTDQWYNNISVDQWNEVYDNMSNEEYEM